MEFWRTYEYDLIWEEICKGILERNFPQGSADVLFNNEEALSTLYAFQKRFLY